MCTWMRSQDWSTLGGDLSRYNTLIETVPVSVRFTPFLPQFLQHHRVDSEKLVVPSLEQILSTLTQRRKLVQGRYYMTMEKEKGPCITKSMLLVLLVNGSFFVCR